MDPSELVDICTPHLLETDVFIGRSPSDRSRPVYGGQFLAQTLMAAGQTVEPGRVPHSLHAYFVRSGSTGIPIRYEVDRIRDGRAFSHRSVVATQDGREVFRQIMSFQVPTRGLRHHASVDITNGLDPSTLAPYRQWVADMSDDPQHSWFAEDLPIDIRIEDPPTARPRAALTGTLRIWMRVRQPVPCDDPVLHAALLAWMSDKTISDVTLYPHARTWTDPGFDMVSLDHSMHFFEPTRADEWTLFTHESPATNSARGLARGDMITLDGRRVGALSQEALMVVPPDALRS